MGIYTNDYYRAKIIEESAEVILNNTIDPASIIPFNWNNFGVSWFLFWFIISYFILLFHTWKIKEIREDVQGVEILFISGVIGLILNWVSINFIQNMVFGIFELFKFVIREITEGLIEYPQNELSINYVVTLLSSILNGFPIIILTGIFLAVFFFLIWIIYEIILLIVIKIIRISIDPHDEFLNTYSRFQILKEYQVGFFLIVFLPVILMFLFWLLFLIIIILMPIPILNRIVVGSLSFILATGLYSYLKKNNTGPKKILSKLFLTIFSIAEIDYIDDIIQEFFELGEGLKRVFVHWGSKIRNLFR